MFIIISNWNLFFKYSSILLYYPMEYLFEIEIYDKRTIIKRWKISSRFSHHSLLFSNLAAVSFIRNFFLETFLCIHRFASCILSWGKEDIARPVCVPLLSGIPYSPSERKKERETWWCDHVLECETSEYRDASGNVSSADPGPCYLPCYLPGRIAKFSRKRPVQ